MSTINIEINHKKYNVPEGTSILKACESNGIYVPTLCDHPDLPPAGKCGLCMVKVDGSAFAYSCMTKCQEGMSIETATSDVLQRQRENLNSFINIKLPPSTKEMSRVYNHLFGEDIPVPREFDKNNSVTFNPDKCILCNRCVRICEDIQHIGALNEPNPHMEENECISCGQCILVCPTGSLTETKSASRFLRALSSGKITILQTAPSVRVAVGENFGDPVGTECSLKIAAAARQLGFKYVIDTNYGADMTILEEGTELIERLTKPGSVLPMFTSCCPAWVNTVERLYPDLMPNLTTAKSPHMMLARAARMYYSKLLGVDPSQLFICSLMPCVAKKDEIEREQLKGEVDCVLTSREFGDLVKQFQIDWKTLEPGYFDDPLAEATGGAAIFGVSGGVTEAAIRYAHELITKKPLGDLVYSQFRGSKSVKSANLTIGDIKFSVAVCNGVGPARELIDTGDYKNFQYIEVMSCPGGCINGGGQPKLPTRSKAAERAKSIFKIDDKSAEKVSNHNQSVLKWYNEFIGEPGSHKAHEFLHTSYKQQETEYLAKQKQMESMPYVGYGSAGGTAMGFARLAASFINSRSVSLNSITLAQVKKRGILILVTSTIGNGEYPNNCIKFAEELEKSKEDLTGVKFAVCGIGSSAYKMFCQAGKNIFRMLKEHGAEELIPLVTIDTSIGDHGEGAFEQFATSICSALNLKPPKIGIKLIYNLIPDDDESVRYEPYRPNTFDICDIKDSFRLTPDDFKPDLNHITFKLQNGMSYEAGGCAAILPRNRPEIVESVIKALELDPYQVYSVKTQGKIDTYIPSKVSVQELFSQYLNLNIAPNRSIIRAFIHVANSEGAEFLEDIIAPSNNDKFKEFTTKYNVGEFICEFVKYGKPDLNLLLSSCPQIQPRLYSIASTPLKSHRELELTITNVEFGEGRNGLCTYFLTKMKPQKVAMRMEPGTICYPDDIETPIIMTCLGAGIAPMLSLIEHRAHIKDPKLGKAIIYFGARNRRGYGKIEEMFENYKKNGIINDYKMAYSRDGPNKVYITDLMRKDKKMIWDDYWKDERAQFFYCGPPRGIPEELGNIMENVVEENAGVSPEEAKLINKKHSYFMEAY